MRCVTGLRPRNRRSTAIRSLNFPIDSLLSVVAPGARVSTRNGTHHGGIGQRRSRALRHGRIGETGTLRSPHRSCRGAASFNPYLSDVRRGPSPASARLAGAPGRPNRRCGGARRPRASQAARTRPAAIRYQPNRTFGEFSRASYQSPRHPAPPVGTCADCSESARPSRRVRSCVCRG